MPGPTDTSVPIVFESGVFRFDEDGALVVHLEHGPDDPHPLATHPDGQDGFIPAHVHEATVVGTGGKGAVTGHFRTAEALPEGLTLTISGYHFVQLEGSGDLSVLVRDPESLPAWFAPGKVHRFARGGSEPPMLWAESPDPTKRAPEPEPWAPPTSEATHTAAADRDKSGCLGMLLGLLPR